MNGVNATGTLVLPSLALDWRLVGALSKRAPVVTATLANDTAIAGTNRDRITRDPAISGRVTGFQTIASIQVSLVGRSNSMSIAPPAAGFGIDTTFSLSRTQLNALAGGTLLDGTHTLRVTARDADLGSTAFDFSFTLDSTPPAPPSGVRLTPATDSGSSNQDNVTKVAAPTLTGTADAGAIVSISRNGTAIGQVTANASNQWQFQLSTLADGIHTFTATATDVAGNVSTPSAPVNVVIDSILPILDLLLPPDDALLGPSSRLIGRADGTGSAVASLTYQIGDRAPISIAVNPVTGNFDQPISAAGIDGIQPVRFTLTDAAGNSKIWTIQAIFDEFLAPPPSITVSLLQDTGTSNSDRITSNPTVSGVFSTTNPVVDLMGSLDGINFFSLSTSLTGGNAFTISEASLASLNGGYLPDAAYTLFLRAKDDMGQWSAPASLPFTLDTTAPTLDITSLIDGIAWIQGTDDLTGQVRSFAQGTKLAYRFDTGTTNLFELESASFKLPLNLPQAVGSHTLSVTTTDLAGNFQTLEYRFLIASLQPPTDDDQWIDPNQPTTGTGGGRTASSWLGSWGGGGSGSYRWGNGMPLNYSSGGDPWGNGNSGEVPQNTGSGYGYELPTYLEKVSIILDEAVNSISAGAATVARKAALYNRLTVLMEVASMVDQGRFYDRMAPVIYGIFDQANNDPIVFELQALDEGRTLAGDLVSSTDAVRVHVFQTELLAVVNHVLIERGFVATNRAEFDQLVDALLALGRTYASLNPSQASDTTTTDFLDSLWRAQQPLDPTTPKPVEQIRAELARGIQALNNLLTEADNSIVDNPIQALVFVNNLLQAATKVESLKTSIRNAKFLRELVEFGFEFAKTNPTATTSSNATNAFLTNFWYGSNTQQMRQEQGGLSWLFEGLDTENKHIEMLDFQKKLIRSLKLIPDSQFQESLRNPSLTSVMIDWGAKYVASLYNQNLVVNNLSGFFQNVSDGYFEQGILVASTNLLLTQSSVSEGMWWIQNRGEDLFRYAFIKPMATVSSNSRERELASRHIPLIIKECLQQHLWDNAKIAYILATANHESKFGHDIFNSGLDGILVEKSGKTPGSQSDLRYFRDKYNNEDNGNILDDDDLLELEDDYYVYRGRGYVQLTGRGNYRKLFDFLEFSPELAQDPLIAARVIVKGMEAGSFTGDRLSEYIDSSKNLRDFYNARKIVNALESAAIVADIANQYYRIIRQWNL